MAVMARIRRTGSEHTDWCARDHRCNLGEHRSDEMIVDVPGVGRMLITRVAAGGREYAELRGRIRLHSTETGARWQITTMLSGLRRLIAAVQLRAGVVQGRDSRPALAAHR